MILDYYNLLYFKAKLYTLFYSAFLEFLLFLGVFDLGLDFCKRDSCSLDLDLLLIYFYGKDFFLYLNGLDLPSL